MGTRCTQMALMAFVQASNVSAFARPLRYLRDHLGLNRPTRMTGPGSASPSTPSAGHKLYFSAM